MIALESLKEEAEKCTRCGACQTVCPVFAELQRETAVARGKISLIRGLSTGQIGISQRLSLYHLQCLGCGACVENCANDVRVDELVLAMRAYAVQQKGLSFQKKLILRGILNSVHLLPLLLKAGSLLQGMVFRKVPKESGLHLRFSLPYLDRRRLIPSIQTPFFLQKHPQLIHLQGRGEKVAVFVGCSINYLFPSVGESTLRLLNRSGLSVTLPKEQTCCGLPAYGSGDLQTARSLALRNMEAFREADFNHLLVPCASCFYFIKHCYPKLFPDDERVRDFTARVVEPSIFFSPLIHFSDESPRRSWGKLRLTYHDPCHLRRGMKIYQEPRRLLRSIPETEFVEMEQADRCCGMGGSFNFIFYDLSRRILQVKLGAIEKASVDAVVTSCMGCMIQLRDGVSQRNMKLPIRHLVEVLDRFADGCV